MAELKNSRHEKFAELVAGGMSATQAYVQAGYKESGAARMNASRLMTNDNVRKRIKSIKRRQADRFTHTKDEALDRLWRIVDDPDAKHADIIAAVRQMSVMVGWNEPDKTIHTVDDEMLQILKGVRK